MHSSEFVSSIMEEPVASAILSLLQSEEIMFDNEIDALDKIGDEVSSAGEKHQVLCRPGTEEDVVRKEEKEKEAGEKTPPFYPSFSKAEFEREFGSDGEEDPKGDYSSDPRSEVEADWGEAEEGGKRLLRARANLPGEDGRTVDAAVTGRSLVVYSHRYKCWADVPCNNDERTGARLERVGWTEGEDLLTVDVEIYSREKSESAVGCC